MKEYDELIEKFVTGLVENFNSNVEKYGASEKEKDYFPNVIINLAIEKIENCLKTKFGMNVKFEVKKWRQI